MRSYVGVLGLVFLGACGSDGGGGDVTNPPTSQTFTLGVSGQGSGSGRVSTASGTSPVIDCALTPAAAPSGTCSGTYSEGSTVTINVTPDAGSVFDGWSGDAASCSTLTSCTISMAANKAVTAQLSIIPTLQIASSAFYPDPNFGSDGAIIWVVEVQNPTSQWIESAEVNFTSHDQAGTVLASSLMFLGPIPPGETRAGKSFADYFGTEASMDVQIADSRVGSEDTRLSAARISSSNYRIDPEFGTDGAIIWTVEVENTSTVELEDVEVDFVTYDAAGKIVDVALTFVGPIPRGEKRASQSFADFRGTEVNVKFQVASVR